MNPWDLSASDLLVWGLVAHCVADWLLQSDWMAANKAKRRVRRVLTHDRGIRLTDPVTITAWWDRHPAAYVHAGIHGAALTLVFGWAALPLAAAHLLIDTRKPVAWLAGVIRQTPMIAPVWLFRHGYGGGAVDLRSGPTDGPLRDHADGEPGSRESQGVAVDMGMLVRMNVDQVWHVVTIAIAALAVTA